MSFLFKKNQIMAFTNTWTNNGLHRKFAGDISGDEILESNFEIHANPKFQKISYVIDDFIDITSLAMDREHLEIMAKTDDIISMTKGALKIALVVADDKGIKLAQTYKKITEDSLFQVEVFLSLDEALNWAK